MQFWTTKSSSSGRRRKCLISRFNISVVFKWQTWRTWYLDGKSSNPKWSCLTPFTWGTSLHICPTAYFVGSSSLTFCVVLHWDTDSKLADVYYVLIFRVSLHCLECPRYHLFPLLSYRLLCMGYNSEQRYCLTTSVQGHTGVGLMQTDKSSFSLWTLTIF